MPPSDPFNLGGPPGLPPSDFDGPPISSDELERAVLADLAERGDDIDSEAERDRRLAERPLVNKQMAVGLAVAGAGALGTAWSYSAATPGGTYAVFWGAIATGAVLFVRGLFRD